MSGYENSGRDKIVQPMHPYVEFYIRDREGNYVDLLRDKNGKPKSLISFTWHEVAHGTGQFSLQLYDSEWVSIEDMLLARSGKVEDAVVVPVVFRFGYVGPGGLVLCDPMRKEGYGIHGMIYTYETHFENWGVRYTLNGETVFQAPADIGNRPKNKRVWQGPMSDIVARIVHKNKWEWEGWIPTPPEELPLVGINHLTTEAEPASYEQDGGESDWDFIRRISSKCRPKDEKCNLFYPSLMSVVPFELDEDTGISRPGKPVTVLRTEFQDFRVPSVREYRVMRDPETEVIRWSPHLDPSIYTYRGGAGTVIRGVDSRLREEVYQMYSEIDSYFKYLKRDTTPNVPATEDLELGANDEKEENEDQYMPEDSEAVEEVKEGTRGGREQLRLLNPPDIDSPPHFLAQFERDRIRMDRAGLLHWMGSSFKFATQAEMEIVGDPKLHPFQHVDVFVYVKMPNSNEVGLHYSTNKYYIDSVVHSIASGSYTTILGLKVGSFRDNTTGEITLAPIIEYEDEEENEAP